MDQQQINIIGLQLTQRFIDRCSSTFFPGIGDPYFGRDEQLFTRHAAFTDGITYLFFVEISLCCIDRTITDSNSIRDTTFALFGSYLINTVTQNRHLDAIIQFYCFHML